MPRRHHLTTPELGLGRQPVRTSVWLVEAGTEVTAGDRLLEIVAGAAVVDLPAPASGVLVELLVGEDEEIVAGQPLAVIEEPAEDEPSNRENDS